MPRYECFLSHGHLLLTRTSRNHRAIHHRRIQTVRKNSFIQFLNDCLLVLHSTIDLRLSSAVLTVRFCLFLSSSCLVRTPEIILNRSVTSPSQNAEHKEELAAHFPVFIRRSCVDASASRCHALSPISGFIKFAFSKSSGIFHSRSERNMSQLVTAAVLHQQMPAN